MQPNETQEIFDVLARVVQRRKWLILASLIAVMIPIIIYNETASPLYEAETMMVFEKFSNPVDNFDFETTKDVFLNNQIEEIQGFSFSKSVLEALPKEIVAKFSLPPIEERGIAFDTIEYVALKIQKNLSASPVRGSNIIRIGFKAKHPEVCKFVANTAADVLRDRNVNLKKEGVGGVRKYIDEQVKSYKIRLDEAEQELRNFKTLNNITSVDREAEEIQRRLTDAEITLNNIRTRRGALENRLGSLNKILAEQKADLVPSITNIGTPWAQQLRKQLVDLNVQYLNLKGQGYKDDHPKMRDIQTNVKKVETELKERALKIVQGDGTTNPIEQIERYVDETLSLQVELESLKAQENGLVGIVGRYEGDLGELPNKEFTLAQLSRERDLNRTIYLSLVERLEEAKISEADQNQDLRIIDRAQLPKDPVSPQKKLNLAVGILLGSLIGFAFAFFLEVKSSTVDTPEDVERIAQVSVVGTIPNINSFSKGKFKQNKIFTNDRDEKNERIYRALISSLEPNTVVAEAYRMLRSNLQFMGVGKQYKTILATSLGPGDGKTTTMTNLAVSFANFGNKTLLIDADLRIPQIHNFFGTQRENGITDILSSLNELDEFVATPTKNTNGSVKTAEAVNGVKANEKNTQVEKLRELQNLFNVALRETGVKNLNFIPSGTKMDTTNHNISTGPMPILLQKYQNKNNVILIDSAPLLLVDDTLMLASMVDAVLLVVHPNKYDKEMLIKAKKMLENANANLIGLVFNNFEVKGQYKKYYAEYSEKVS